jgi:hypothetical protein
MEQFPRLYRDSLDMTQCGQGESLEFGERNPHVAPQESGTSA